MLTPQALFQQLDLDEVLRDNLPQKIIRSLPVPDLYFALQDVRDDSRQEVLALVLPEQMQGIIDMDIWERDRMDLFQLREWVQTVLLAMPEGRAVLHILNLDFELLTALVVSEFTVLAVGPEYEKDAPSEEADWQSPDGRFWLWRRAVPIHESSELAGKTLDLLYRYEPEKAAAILLEASLGLHSEIEETARRFRDARLADLGFPEWDTAQAVWNPRKGLQLATPALEDAPQYAAGEVARRAGLRERFDKLSVEQQARIAEQLVILTNAVVITDAIPMRDRSAVERALGMTAGFLELGLAQPEGEGLLLQSVQAVFQLGLGRVAPLGRRARLLTQSGTFDRWSKPLTLLPAAEVAFVQALAHPHPRFVDPRSPENVPVPFASEEQVHWAEAALHRLEMAALLFFGEKGMATLSTHWEAEDLIPPREERTIDTLLGTLLARIVLRQPPGIEPVDGRDIRRLLESLEQLADFHTQIAKLAGSAETPLGAWLRDQAERWLDDLRGAAGNPQLVSSVLQRPA